MAYTPSNANQANFTFEAAGYVPGLANFTFGLEEEVYTEYNVLAGTLNNFVAVWADADASLINNKFYASTVDAFSVCDIANHSLVDYYTMSFAGGFGETLNSDDIVDINITG